MADPEEYLSRLPRWKRLAEGVNKAMGFPALMINFMDLSPGIMRVWADLEARGAVDDDGQPATP